jgi:hypothetical protein
MFSIINTRKKERKKERKRHRWTEATLRFRIHERIFALEHIVSYIGYVGSKVQRI